MRLDRSLALLESLFMQTRLLFDPTSLILPQWKKIEDVHWVRDCDMTQTRPRVRHRFCLHSARLHKGGTSSKILCSMKIAVCLWSRFNSIFPKDSSSESSTRNDFDQQQSLRQQTSTPSPRRANLTSDDMYCSKCTTLFHEESSPDERKHNCTRHGSLSSWERCISMQTKELTDAAGGEITYPAYCPDTASRWLCVKLHFWEYHKRKSPFRYTKSICGSSYYTRACCVFEQ